MTSQQKLQELALRLRNAAPETWEEFLTAFERLTAEFTVAVTVAEQNEILRVQGQAQAFILLLRVFKECGVAGNQPTPQ